MAVNMPSSPSSSTKKTSLEKLLDSLESNVDVICDESSFKKPRGKLKTCIVNVKVCARAVGLSHEDILGLVNVAASLRYGIRISCDLIQCCIPQTTFPQRAAIRLLSCINHHTISEKANTSFTKLVFHWIVLVMPYMDAYDKLHAVYNVFFYLLRNYDILPEICYILSELTLYPDVTLFRINELILLWKKTGNVPSLIGLLTKYKMLQPDKLGLSLPKYQRFYRSPNSKMQKIIQAVQLRRGLELKALAQKSVNSPVRKKAKLSKLIPQVQSSVNDYVPTSDIVRPDHFPETVSFNRILTFEDLLQYIDQIQLPIQMGSVIDNPLLQYLITYNKNRHITGQFNWWLYHTCYDALLENSVPYSDYLEEFLSKLAGFMRRVKEGTPAIEYFLYQFLDTWDGFHFNQSIFKLIPHIRIHKFSELHQILLEPLKKIFFRRGTYLKCRILITLTELVTNYINKWHHLHLLRKSKTTKSAIAVEYEYLFLLSFFLSFFFCSLLSVLNALLLNIFMHLCVNELVED
ncbi:centromere protein I-like isoform X1 [Octopus sinensis]|uniref:Centromere protein I-like isoform X1 n=1 Tax=Octopus sinensis TaxID=2607531 RepID=A0A7E6EJH5_9MOLL|nr:centromere protein I-like isoform X1 [Octopus sinensis]